MGGLVFSELKVTFICESVHESPLVTSQIIRRQFYKKLRTSQCTNQKTEKTS